MSNALGQATPSIELQARNRFVDALTEIQRTAADESSQDRVSALRALASAAKSLADTLEHEALDDDPR